MAAIAFLGVGLSYRWDFQPHLARGNPGVDWLEVLAKRFPLAGHGLELSVGSDGVDGPGYSEDLKRREGPHADQPHGVAYKKLVRA